MDQPSIDKFSYVNVNNWVLFYLNTVPTFSF